MPTCCASRWTARPASSAVDSDGWTTRWSEFPIDHRPRPVVLLQSAVSIGEHGFVDGQAKVAWISGAIVADVPVPAAVLALLNPHRRDGGGHQPLTIGAATRTHAPFVTDRGARELPAFALDVSGLHEPCIVLDPETQVWWPPIENWDPIEGIG